MVKFYILCNIFISLLVYQYDMKIMERKLSEVGEKKRIEERNKMILCIYNSD